MRCAIMQPTYLPWAGYFNLMDSVDQFVFLDDAQLQKNSWHCRNRILIKNESHWITVPIRHEALSQQINHTVLFEDKKWRRKHRTMLLHAYARHPFISIVDEICNELQNEQDNNLALLNTRMICYIAKKLKITTPTLLSSTIPFSGKRTERILNILDILGATEYLSPIGAASYLAEDGFSEQNKILLRFQNYEPKPYIQIKNKNFIPHLSIIDILANLGWDNSALYIREKKWD